MERTILWFRNDLRLHDNALFHHASAQTRAGREIICAYCAGPRLLSGRLAVTGLPKVGVRRSIFVRQCVQDLQQSLRRIGGDLLVFNEEPAVILPRLAEAPGVNGLPKVVRVLVSQEVATEEEHEESSVELALKKMGVKNPGMQVGLERVWGLTLYHLDDLPYRDVRRELPMQFAPFGRAVRGNFRAADSVAVEAAQKGERGVRIREELASPRSLQPPPESVHKLSHEDLLSVWPPSVEQPQEHSPNSLEPWWDVFQGGESFGLQRLSDFISKDLSRYKQTRNGLLGLRCSSKMSPWIAAGCVSPRRVARAVWDWERTHAKGSPTPSSAHYVSEYGWRDYLIFLSWKCGPRLFHLQGPGKVRLEWSQDKDMIKRFTCGQTGMPLIDAAVREMKASGFMSNRARQFVASYLILELKLDWRIGAELFESLLIDYSVYANWGNWMRAAGVTGQGFGNGGSRWFNLAEERDRFDPRGEFVRAWVAELQHVPREYIHVPWTMSAEVQERYACQLGVDYPLPMDTASKQALEGQAAAAVAPAWHSTTRDGKVHSAGNGKGRSRELPERSANEAELPLNKAAPKRRWQKRTYY